MRTSLILILIIGFVSSQAKSQLYIGYMGWLTCFVDVNKDSAHVEIYSVNPHGYTNKSCDEIIFPDSNENFKSFKGKQSQLIFSPNYYLLYKPGQRKKTFKIKLKPCEIDNREKFRNDSYASDKITILRGLQDSLRCSNNDYWIDIDNTIISISNHQWMDSNFIKLVDDASDTIKKDILAAKNPKVDYYYKISDSIEQLDTSNIYDLLSSANYKCQYGQYFLYQLSAKKPECLISYIDKNPTNKDSLLRSIKDSEKFKEIVNNVKNSPYKTKGRKEILRQKTKRIAGDIAVAGLYGTMVLAEFTLPILLIIWIF